MTQNTTDDYTKKHYIIKIIKISIALGIIALVLGLNIYVHKETANALDNQDYVINQADFNRDQLGDWLDNADRILKEISYDDVADPTTIDNLKEDYTDAQNVVTTSYSRVEAPSGVEYATVENNTDKISKINSLFKDSTDKIKIDCESARKSYSLKLRQNDLEALKKTVDNAKSLYDTTVLDSSTIDELKAAVDNSTKAQETDPSTINNSDIYTSNTDTINAAINKVNESHTAYEKKKAEEEAAAAAARAKTVSNKTYNTTTNNSSGVWSPSYYNDYWASSAAADGSLTQWTDNYFIAHRSSNNGKIIASKPQYVSINGKTYKYVGTMYGNYANNTDATPYIDYAQSNGGIGFQTCTANNGFEVNHYEPVD